MIFIIEWLLGRMPAWAAAIGITVYIYAIVHLLYWILK